MVFLHRVVGRSVVGYEESPASAVTVVLVAAMEEVTVEEESVSCLQFHIDQGENLREEETRV